MGKNLLILITILISLSAEATIYGTDDFMDVLGTNDSAIIEASRSVAVQVTSANILVSNGKWRTLKDSMVCKDERFVDQPLIGAYCTAFLVAPDILLTAAHCFANVQCSQSSWLFDFKMQSESQTDFKVDTANLYSCKEIIKSSYANKLDYALVRLDRPVEKNRKPLTLNPNLKVQEGQNVISIGAPRGLALKASRGKVRSADSEKFFTSNLDSMSGSSGSPVFDAKTMQVIGIVASGENDYELREPEFCNAYKRCKDDECRGEDATRISQLPLIP